MPDNSRSAKMIREHTFCPHCNRVLWVGDECDCPESAKPEPKPESAEEAIGPY